MTSVLNYKNNKDKVSKIKGINPIIAEILYNRGYETTEAMTEFMNDDISYDGKLMKDLEKAARIIADVIANKEEIVIYSDHDCDGTCGASVAMIILTKLGAIVSYYTNNRFIDGYGMCRNGIDSILATRPDTKLFITVDNGIATVEPIAYAKSLGINVVVTDHHAPPKIIPTADAVVNPKQLDCAYPFKGLCGAGVIYKVLRDVCNIMGVDTSIADDTLDIVALATVGDIVPLIDENRSIVKKGIALINTNPSKPFKALTSILGIEDVSAHGTMAYTFTPMINALSRIDGDSHPGIRLFCCDDEEEMKAIVAKMIRTNDARKVMSKDQYETAQKLLAERKLPSVIVLYDSTFTEGIVGITAGRLKEEYNRPVIVMTLDNEGICKGSCRSIDSFDIKVALDTLAELLISHGGHDKAAGVSLCLENVEEFDKRINELANEVLTESDFKQQVVIDASVVNKEVTLELMDALKKIEPFGEGFPEPVFGLTFKYSNTYYMGAVKEHLKLFDRENDFSIIGWRCASKFNTSTKDFTKAIGSPSVNVYNDKTSVQFIIKDELMF